MTSLEKIEPSKPTVIETRLPGVTIQDIDQDHLPDLQKMLSDNELFFAQGGMVAESLYKMIKTELLADEASPTRRLGVWQDDKLIGMMSVSPYKNGSEDEVEISGGGDKAFARQGIAFAAAEAIIEDENNKGKDVVAEVESYNVASVRLLGKLGFQATHRHSSDGRNIFVHPSWEKNWTEADLMHHLGL